MCFGVSVRRRKRKPIPGERSPRACLVHLTPIAAAAARSCTSSTSLKDYREGVMLYRGLRPLSIGGRHLKLHLNLRRKRKTRSWSLDCIQIQRRASWRSFAHLNTKWTGLVRFDLAKIAQAAMSSDAVKPALTMSWALLCVSSCVICATACYLYCGTVGGIVKTPPYIILEYRGAA